MEKLCNPLGTMKYASTSNLLIINKNIENIKSRLRKII